jgi:hypothetical protein
MEPSALEFIRRTYFSHNSSTCARKATVSLDRNQRLATRNSRNSLQLAPLLAAPEPIALADLEAVLIVAVFKRMPRHFLPNASGNNIWLEEVWLNHGVDFTECR